MRARAGGDGIAARKGRGTRGKDVPKWGEILFINSKPRITNSNQSKHCSRSGANMQQARMLVELHAHAWSAPRRRQSRFLEAGSKKGKRTYEAQRCVSEH